MNDNKREFFIQGKIPGKYVNKVQPSGIFFVQTRKSNCDEERGKEREGERERVRE